MNIQEKNKKGFVYAVFCISSAILCSIFNFLMLLLHSDVRSIDGVYNTVLFKSGALSNCFYILLVLVTAALLSAIFVFRRTEPVFCPTTKARIQFCCAAAGILLIGVVVMQFVLKTTGLPYAFNNDAFSIRNPSSMQKISLVFAVLASPYFLVPLFAPENRATRILHVVCGLFLVFFFCAQLLVTHEFMNDFLFSPTRIYSICTYSFLVFFVLSEIRMHLDGRAMPGAFAATGMAAFFFAVIEGLPKIALSFMGKAGYTIGLDSFYVLLKLFVGVYALISVLPTLLEGKTRQKAAGQTAAPNEAPSPSETPEAAPEDLPAKGSEEEAVKDPEEAPEKEPEEAPEEVFPDDGSDLE